MTMHAGGGPPSGRQRLLFTPGARLGWTFRDRRSLITPYSEPPPDLGTIRQQAVARAATAERSYQRARLWAARPSLMLAVLLAMLAGCAKAINPGVHTMGTLLAALVLCGPGLGWTVWRWHQRSQAAATDPALVYQQARQDWEDRAGAHELTELSRLEHVPEWGSAQSPARRTDIFGGTLTGWRSLLAVHGASIMAAQPLLVADLSGQYAAGNLSALTRDAGVQVAEYALPRDLDRCGVLSGLSARQLADALAEAIHAGPPGHARTDRAVDVRVLEQLTSALAGHGLTPARLAAAVQAALGRNYPAGLLTTDEAGLIRGPLFGEDYKTHIGANLVRLDAFLSGLADYTGTGPPAAPPPSWCTIMAAEPAARSVRAELIAALVIQWLTVQVTISTRHVPAVVIAAADEITRHHLERLADACEGRGVPLTLLFRHLRDDATAMIGGGATAFMRLGNHQEAEQAAAFIGRHHTFVLSGWTATMGGEHTTTHGTTQTWGNSQSHGLSSTRGWAEDPMSSRSASGSHTRSREYGQNYSYSTEQSESDGQNWSDATSTQRVYEYSVEPTVLQNLPDNALLLAARPAGTSLQPVECHPGIVTLPHVSTTPHRPVLPAQPQPAMSAETGRPQLAPRPYQSRWPQQPPDTETAWPRSQWRRDDRGR
ncbi:MAG: hypothetical protein JO345_33045 [Streptosporangiaceae bacterium]|nr:hypothetical protein [Streptosporangiaceae bacterium]